MAQAIFNSLCNEDITAISCGIAANDGESISDYARQALCENGIKFEHTATSLTSQTVADADYIVGMTASHAARIASLFPEHTHKIFAFPADISDPFGGSIDEYRQAFDEISKGVKSIIKVICDNERY